MKKLTLIIAFVILALTSKAAIHIHIYQYSIWQAAHNRFLPTMTKEKKAGFLLTSINYNKSTKIFEYIYQR